MHTPWGQADFTTNVAEGIVHVITPGHGGYRLSPARRAQMPEHLRRVETFAGGDWYEEDCDWCLVALAFPEYFQGTYPLRPNIVVLDDALRVCQRAHPEAYRIHVQLNPQSQ